MDEFTNKKLLYGKDALDKLEQGISEVAKAVGATMGRGGNLVMVEESQENPYPLVTKDGVTVASQLKFKDQAVDYGAQFVIQACRKQVHETGDGTSLTAILTDEFFKAGRKLLGLGYVPSDIIQGLQWVVDHIIENIQSQSVKDVSSVDLLNIALVSTNNDFTISELISDAVAKTGEFGIVTMERAYQDGHSVEYQDGYQLNIGIQAREFANVEGRAMILENPFVLVTDQPLIANKLIPVLKLVSGNTEEGRKPTLIIVSPHVGSEVMQVMKRNITDPNGQFFIAHIRPSGDLRPEKNRMILEDIASITGGMFISQDSGYQIDKLNINQIGRCDRILSNPEKTLITGSSKCKDLRIEQLKSQMEETNDVYQKELMKESIARLSGGMAIVKVGGRNLSEQGEIMHRVDDAIHACQSASAMGYVRGGGIAMLNASRDVMRMDVIRTEFLGCCSSPAKKILRNANRSDWQKILNDHEFGYDIETGESRDMLEIGIIDPTKVIVHAIMNSASVVKSMLKTTVLILKDDESCG